MKKVIAGVLVASCVLSGVPMPQHVRIITARKSTNDGNWRDFTKGSTTKCCF